MSVARLYGRVAENARPVKFSRVLLTVLVALFFAVGWAVGMGLRGVALALGWAGEAARLGFRDGRGKKERP